MSELTRIVQEWVDDSATCLPNHSSYDAYYVCKECRGRGNTERTIDHSDDCIVKRMEAALAAHEAEMATLVAIKDAAENVHLITYKIEFDGWIEEALGKLRVALEAYRASTK